jgi:hypothetical protein
MNPSLRFDRLGCLRKPRSAKGSLSARVCLSGRWDQSSRWSIGFPIKFRRGIPERRSSGDRATLLGLNVAAGTSERTHDKTGHRRGWLSQVFFAGEVDWNGLGC